MIYALLQNQHGTMQVNFLGNILLNRGSYLFHVQAKINFIQVYSPTTSNTDDEVGQFYSDRNMY